MDWAGMLRLSLLARLATLVTVHRDCRDLFDQMASESRRPVNARVAELLEGRRNRELHRDYAGAARAAFGAFVTLLLGCVLWIGSGWADGATAVMLAGVFLALFSATENPIASLRAFMIGTLIASLAGAIYGYAILPRINGFVMLAAALAPVLLIGGALMASARFGPIALPAMMGMGSPALLSAQLRQRFRGVHQRLAGRAGRHLVRDGDDQPAPVGGGASDDPAHRARRLARYRGPRQPHRSARCARLDQPHARSHRPAGAAARGDRRAEAGKPLYDALRDLRTGVAIGELRQLRRDCRPRKATR